MEAPHRNPGRCGERGRQEAVERLQRLLRLEREQQPWWPQAGRGSVSSDLLVGFLQILF